MLVWNLKIDIAIDIAHALTYLHSRTPRIIHRDLKSSNIMIREDWSAFLVDFGTAKEQMKTDPGTKFLGTTYWIAPEMFDEKALTTSALDIYGFGMILYELLTRNIPIIRGFSADGARPEIPAAATQECPRGYVELMKACWSQDSKNRPSLGSIFAQLNKMKKIIALNLKMKLLVAELALILPMENIQIIALYSVLGTTNDVKHGLPLTANL